VAAKIRGLALVGGIGAGNLGLQALDIGRQQAVEFEGIALLETERGALVARRPVQQGGAEGLHIERAVVHARIPVLMRSPDTSRLYAAAL